MELRSLTPVFGGLVWWGEDRRNEDGLSMQDLDVELLLAVTPSEVSRGVERSISWRDGTTDRTIRVRVPVGVTSGTRLRFAGEGRTGQNGQVGDLYVRLEVHAEQDARNSRLAGCILLAIGTFLVAVTEYSARREGTYGVAATFLGPFALAVGLGLLVHAPKLPILRAERRESLYLLAGALGGAGNLYRFGALDPGSRVRLPILVGVSAMVLYSIYQWVRASYWEGRRRRTRG
jgi:hypothetical protein